MRIAFPSPLRNAVKYSLGLTLAFQFAFVSIESVHGDDWPRWRGAKHNDTSTETDLLTTWPEGGPKQLWVNKTSGLGYAGVSIVGDSLFTMGLEDGAEFALCLNAETGKELWRTNIGTQFKNGWGDGPRTTPTVDGENVYFITGKGTLACLKASDGSEVWKKEMTTDLNGAVPFWGYSESPLVDGELVICTPCGPNKAAMVALNKNNGDIVWKSENYKVGKDENKSYSSIVPAEIDGKKQYIQLTMKNLIGVAADNGELLWKSSWPGAVAVIPSPVVDGNRVYVTSGYGVGSKMVEIKDRSASDIWMDKAMKNHHGGVVMVGDHIYGYSDKAGWICQDKATGELVWNEKKIKKGAVAYADGLFYHIQEANGEVILIKADPKGMEVQGRFELSPQTKRRANRGMIWMHPVISDGKLYLRDQELIHCYDIRESK